MNRRFYALFVILFFGVASFGQTSAQRNELPKRVRILNNYGAIPFEDGKTVVNEVVFDGLDADFEPSDGQKTIFLTPESVGSYLRSNRLSISVGETFDGAKVAKVVKAVREWAIESGFPDARVTAFGEATGRKTMRLTISVERGELGRYSGFVFEGNEQVSEDELAEELTKCLGDDSKVYRPREIQYAAKKCAVGLLWSRGFMRGELRGVQYRSTEKGNVVTIMLNEGPRYRYGTIEFTGFKAFSKSELQEMLGQKEGDAVNGKAIQKVVYERFLQAYLDRGYLLYNADFDVDLIEPLEYGTDGIAGLYVRIDEGPQFRISRIKFTGVDDSTETLLLRDFPVKAGEIYSSRLIKAAIGKLNASDAFEAVDDERGIQTIVDKGRALVELIIPLQKRD